MTPEAMWRMTPEVAAYGSAVAPPQLRPPHQEVRAASFTAPPLGGMVRVPSRSRLPTRSSSPVPAASMSPPLPLGGWTPPQPPPHWGPPAQAVHAQLHSNCGSAAVPAAGLTPQYHSGAGSLTVPPPGRSRIISGERLPPQGAAQQQAAHIRRSAAVSSSPPVPQGAIVSPVPSASGPVVMRPVLSSSSCPPGCSMAAAVCTSTGGSISLPTGIPTSSGAGSGVVRTASAGLLTSLPDCRGHGSSAGSGVVRTGSAGILTSLPDGRGPKRPQESLSPAAPAQRTAPLTAAVRAGGS